METDIRLDLEDELEKLEESKVEDWIQRCFAACDPRYDSDWLSSIFELSLLQFPDNYEVRAACSQAGVMEARRLSEETDLEEAIARLERVLESDPYCTEAFELMEVLIQRRPEAGSDPVSAAPVAAPVTPAPPGTVPGVGASSTVEDVVTTVVASPEAPPVAPVPSVTVTVPTPAPTAAAQVAPRAPVTAAEETSDLSFLEDDILGDLNIAPVPGAAAALQSADFLALNELLAEPTVSSASAEPPIHMAPAVPAHNAASADPVIDPAPRVESQVPAATAPAAAASASPPSSTAPALAVPAPAPARSWSQVWALPGSSSGEADSTYESLVLAMAEKMRAAGRFRSAARLLADFQDSNGESPAVMDLLQKCVLHWIDSLEKESHQKEAAQVAHWALHMFPAGDFQLLAQRLGPAPPLPSLLSAQSELQQRLAQSPEDSDAIQAVLATYSGNPGELQSFFRSLAVNAPSDHRTWLNLGRVYLQTGQPVLSLVHTQRALKLSPSRRGYELLAEVYAALQQPQLQQQALQQLRQLSSTQ